MPLVRCPGPDCGGCRISVSAVPGGNPVAAADPNTFATSYLVCACGQVRCDRCGRSGCPSCGAAMHPPSGAEAQDLAARLNGLVAGVPDPDAGPGPAARRPGRRGPLRCLADWLRGS